MNDFYNGVAFEIECADCDAQVIVGPDCNAGGIYCPECGDKISDYVN